MKIMNRSGFLVRPFFLFMALVLVLCVLVPAATGEAETKYSVGITGMDYYEALELTKALKEKYPDILCDARPYYWSSDGFDVPLSDQNQGVVAYLCKYEEDKADTVVFGAEENPKIYYGINICSPDALSVANPNFAIYYWASAIGNFMLDGTEIHLYYTTDDSTDAVTTRECINYFLEYGALVKVDGADITCAFEEISEGVYTFPCMEGCGTLTLIEATDPVVGENGEETELWQVVYNDMLARIGITE